MLGTADYGDYVRYLRDSTVVLRKLAAREQVEDKELIEIADHLAGLADALSMRDPSTDPRKI
jgi:hypothetical protein